MTWAAVMCGGVGGLVLLWRVLTRKVLEAEGLGDWRNGDALRAIAASDPTLPFLNQAAQEADAGKRCGWCAQRLRWWQRRSCRRCGLAISDPLAGPPCRAGSRMTEQTDRAPWRTR